MAGRHAAGGESVLANHEQRRPNIALQAASCHPPVAVPQFVVRYRRGIPWNRKRAAWWINYDLLAETGRVAPIFVMSGSTLGKTYGARNRIMGKVQPGIESPEALAAMERSLTTWGPQAKWGLRAPLWQPPESDRHV